LASEHVCLHQSSSAAQHPTFPQQLPAQSGYIPSQQSQHHLILFGTPCFDYQTAHKRNIGGLVARLCHPALRPALPEMRLLDVRTLQLRTFYGDAIPKYAVLSHNWFLDSEEVTFQQIQTPDACRNVRGFRKIELLCEQAQRDGYDNAWIDTCCIDKSNSSELSEAINSMFAWYAQASICYAFLADVEQIRGDNFLESRWWSRAW
jgi:hypothetical protein